MKQWYKKGNKGTRNYTKNKEFLLLWPRGRTWRLACCWTLCCSFAFGRESAPFRLCESHIDPDTKKQKNTTQCSGIYKNTTEFSPFLFSVVGNENVENDFFFLFSELGCFLKIFSGENVFKSSNKHNFTVVFFNP